MLMTGSSQVIDEGLLLIDGRPCRDLVHPESLRFREESPGSRLNFSYHGHAEPDDKTVQPGQCASWLEASGDGLTLWVKIRLGDGELFRGRFWLAPVPGK